MTDHEAESDTGTVVPSNCWAAMWSPELGYHFLVPKSQQENAEVPAEAIALTGAFIRLECDEDFRKECAKWFRRQGLS